MNHLLKRNIAVKQVCNQWRDANPSYTQKIDNAYVENLVQVAAEEIVSSLEKEHAHKSARAVNWEGVNDILTETDRSVKATANIRANLYYGLKNERGEYRRWLMTFTPGNGDISAWCAWPWVFEWEPDSRVLVTLDGLCALGGFTKLPPPWPEWQRARHRLDEWVMTNGPARAALDAAVRREREQLKLRSDNANTGPSSDRTEAVRNG